MREISVYLYFFMLLSTYSSTHLRGIFQQNHLNHLGTYMFWYPIDSLLKTKQDIAVALSCLVFNNTFYCSYPEPCEELHRN